MRPLASLSSAEPSLSTRACPRSNGAGFSDSESGRLLIGLGHVGLGHVGLGHVGLGHVGPGHVGLGHALTIDTALGVASDEHFNALPRDMARWSVLPRAIRRAAREPNVASTETRRSRQPPPHPVTRAANSQSPSQYPSRRQTCCRTLQVTPRARPGWRRHWRR